METAAHQYAHENRARFLEQLKTLIRIPSVSTQPHHAADVQRAADWLAADLTRIGFESVEQIHEETGRHPLVFASSTSAPTGAPTVLIYSHYDVQPAKREDGWQTDPFDPVEKNGRLFARGATDSKINLMSQLKGLEALMATGAGRLPVNVKVVFEGEEESGSETFNAFAATQGDRLRADVSIICDGGVIQPDQPSLVCGLRGIISFEIAVTGPIRDLHSGHYGGTVHNPLQALAEILAALHDRDGRVAVPGFYDQVRSFTDLERAAWADINPIFDEAWRQVAAAPEPWGEPGFSLHERTGIRPTLEINGLVGGYTAAGVKTVLPRQALAKISCRLVPDQDPERTFGIVTDFIRQIAPPTVVVEIVRQEMGAAAVWLDHRSPAMRLAAQAYETHWGRPVTLEMAGGSVPITHTLLSLVDQLVIMGFTHKGGRAHGPNEYIELINFERGTGAAITFLQLLAASGFSR